MHGATKKIAIARARFSRIDPTKIKFEDPTIADNRYESAGFDENHYAARAHKDLIVTKGKGFTKEKNKVCLIYFLL